MKSDRLYRKKEERMIAGIAAGLSEHLGVDTLWIRLAFVVLAIAGGGGLIIYIILWIFVPEDEYNTLNYQQMDKEEKQYQESENMNYAKESHKFTKEDEIFRNKRSGNVIGGLVLITLGTLFLIDRFIPRIDFGDLWPVILVVIGIALMINGLSGSKKNK